MFGVGFSGQMLTACMLDCIMNDFFLQQVSAAPRNNTKLMQILEAVLEEYVKVEDDLQSFPEEIQGALTSVCRCFRGLYALLSPEVGAYGSKSTDVEAIARNKRARTSKSGVPGGAPDRGPEIAINQLISASEYWGGKVQEFWKTAPRALALQPTLQECLKQARAEESGEEVMSCKDLALGLERLTEFKNSLREGAYTEFDICSGG